ncbi:hypothetical protein STCU_01660 [Strigomonas culicis]|uniref:Uncharacterized protein n=1 Tax=Strigomonas culicis TaxID=28005 RepID=S9WEZ9_9TRYP|nr:hypothetical protein STCU_06721 [Strigomonas culicis]EPY34310.1 hypothetical protein STCU_01660 [Strigomonas culicis]|eukprot:EPY25522.1 hypothetical protein STCU_06721 [Strigomonas culicis]
MPQLSSQNRRWSIIQCNEYPPGRIGHTFCADTAGTKAYVYGGVNDTEDVSCYLEDFWEYDVVEKQWTSRPLTGDVHYSRAFHTAVWHKDRMFIFGGCNGRARFNKLFTIDANGFCASAETVTHPPMTRYCHSAVVFEGSMYIFGGKCGGRNSNKRLSDLYRCNLNTPEWTECEQSGEQPPPRSAHAALTHERTMIICGGRNVRGECCEDFYMYHFDTCTWRIIITPHAPSFGRARNSAIVHHGTVVIFGGWNGKKKLNDLIMYNAEANAFEAPADYDPASPSRRECHVAVMCRDTMVVFGGRFRGIFMSDTTELYLGPPSAIEDARDWLLEAGFLQKPGGQTLPFNASDLLPPRLQDVLICHSVLHDRIASNS